MQNNWHSYLDCSFHFEDQTVHIWKLPLELTPRLINQMQSILSTDEKKRAARFHFDKDRHAYMAARGQLRILLAKYLGKTAQEIALGYNEYGKPYVKNAALQFNVSHSGRFGLIAFDADWPVGVDIEKMRPDFGGMKIARHFFSAHEIGELSRLPIATQQSAFFNGWTRKEAYIKALGKGLVIPLHQFSVSLAPDKAALLLSTEHDPAQKMHWKLFALPAPLGYAAAVIVNRIRNHVLLFELNQEFIANYFSY